MRHTTYHDREGYRRAQWKPSVQGPPLVQRTMIRDIFDPIAVKDEQLLSCDVFKLVYIKHGDTQLL